MKLDTTYRPQTFDEVIGQDITVYLLKAIVYQKQFSSAYMFSGPSGVGKTTMGRIFSKAILCDSSVSGNPCGICPSCIMFQEEKHFGYRELDAASYGDKESMIKLRDDAFFQSIGKKKIILLDECHDITRQAQDTLLKQLEQCPDHLIYIFCTTEPENVKPTVRKRCIHFQVSRVASSLIFDRLKTVCSKEKIQFEEDALRVIADRANGHVRDSLKLLEEVAYLGPATLDSVLKVSQDFSQDIFEVLNNLGYDLKKSLDALSKISTRISAWDLYEQIVSMAGDCVKLIYGYDDFIPQRKELLVRLRDTHGSSMIEFLNYLLNRDKYVDRIGIQSDIILLHYKFCADVFKSQVPVQLVAAPEQSVPEITKPIITQSSPALTHAQLQKMSIADRSRVLREQRRTNQNPMEKEEEPKIPSSWSLPKEERHQGANSFDDKELSPLEFSKTLVGGRGGPA